MTGSRRPHGPQFRPGARCSDCDAPYYTGIEAWFRACAPRLRGLIRSWGGRGPHLDEDDIVQETFADLCRQFSEVDNPGGWLIEVARRKVARTQELAAQMAIGDAAELLQDPRSRVRWASLAQPAEPEDGLDLRATLQAMASLPEGQRISLYLAQVEDWTHAKIADYLGIKPATVAVHVHHARNALSGRRPVPKYSIRINGGGNFAIGNFAIGDHATIWNDRGDRSNPGTTPRTLHSPVWVWCRCWTSEPHRWWQRVKNRDRQPGSG